MKNVSTTLSDPALREFVANPEAIDWFLRNQRDLVESPRMVTGRDELRRWLALYENLSIKLAAVRTLADARRPGNTYLAIRPEELDAILIPTILCDWIKANPNDDPVIANSNDPCQECGRPRTEHRPLPLGLVLEDITTHHPLSTE